MVHITTVQLIAAIVLLVFFFVPCLGV